MGASTCSSNCDRKTMTDTNLEKAILRAQLKILLKLSDLAEESSWIDAWIDLKSEILRKLKNLN